MYYDFEDILKSLELGFGKPKNIKFNTPNTKDLLPSYWSKWEEQDKENSGEKVQKGYKCVCRTVGINPEDINLTMEDYGICLDAKTIYDDEFQYTQHIELPISESIISDIKSINYRSKNGVTYIYLEMKKPEKKKVAINKI